MDSELSSELMAVANAINTANALSTCGKHLRTMSNMLSDASADRSSIDRLHAALTVQWDEISRMLAASANHQIDTDYALRKWLRLSPEQQRQQLNRNKFAAIKMLRQMFGGGLRECKKFLDSITG